MKIITGAFVAVFLQVARQSALLRLFAVATRV